MHCSSPYLSLPFILFVLCSSTNNKTSSLSHSLYTYTHAHTHPNKNNQYATAIEYSLSLTGAKGKIYNQSFWLGQIDGSYSIQHVNRFSVSLFNMIFSTCASSTVAHFMVRVLASWRFAVIIQNSILESVVNFVEIFLFFLLAFDLVHESFRCVNSLIWKLWLNSSWKIMTLNDILDSMFGCRDALIF